MEEKLCKKCGHLKPTTEFYFTNKVKGYLKSYCIPCDSKRQAKYYVETIDERTEVHQQYNQTPIAKFLHKQRTKTNPIYKQHARNYYLRNRDEKLAYAKKHYYETKQN